MLAMIFWSVANLWSKVPMTLDIFRCMQAVREEMKYIVVHNNTTHYVSLYVCMSHTSNHSSGKATFEASGPLTFRQASSWHSLLHQQSLPTTQYFANQAALPEFVLFVVTLCDSYSRPGAHSTTKTHLIASLSLLSKPVVQTPHLDERNSFWQRPQCVVFQAHVPR